MTTATPTTKWDATLVYIKWGLSEVSAEYHPNDGHGAMKYSLHVNGGKGNGVVIQCKTELSVMKLFNEVVALHKQGIEHPYLQHV
jgi:hypothetical protein